MTTKYILTHTPREIANKHTLEEIQNEIVYSVVGEFDDSNVLIGGFSWEELADDIPDLTYCQNAVNEWFEEREPKDRPTAKTWPAPTSCTAPYISPSSALSAWMTRRSITTAPTMN